MHSHTDKTYEEELKTLKQDILKMGSEVEDMLMQSVETLGQNKQDLAKSIIERDAGVDRSEMAINELCVRILALRQPAASDLRFITVGIRISNDLERIGDLSSNIAKKSKEVGDKVFKPHAEMIHKLAVQAQKMVKDALDAFVNENADLAKQVLQDDDIVDTLNGELHQIIVDSIKADASEVSDYIRLLLICRHLERVADHATNIAEEVVYVVKGQDIRHQHN